MFKLQNQVGGGTIMKASSKTRAIAGSALVGGAFLTAICTGNPAPLGIFAFLLDRDVQCDGTDKLVASDDLRYKLGLSSASVPAMIP